MLVKFYEGTQDWLLLHFQNIIQKNYQKLSAVMMATKLFLIVVLLSIVPLDTIKIKQPENEIAIRFDQTKPLVFEGKDRRVVIETADSNLDLAQKSSARQIAYAGGYGQGVERDPAYFRALYQRAGAAYGVPWQLIEAVHYVETGASDSTSESSYAGAMGPMQFMPGTWNTYGVDADGNGVADITNVNDAVYGAANLLAQSGAAEGNYQSALLNYNHAQWYVNKVMSIARDAGM